VLFAAHLRRKWRKKYSSNGFGRMLPTYNFPNCQKYFYA
jgi:hypothetical protein